METSRSHLSDQLLSIRPTRVNIGLRLPPVARSLPSLLCLVTFRSAVTRGEVGGVFCELDVVLGQPHISRVFFNLLLKESRALC